RAELNRKFGRTGDLNADINARGRAEAAGEPWKAAKTGGTANSARNRKLGTRPSPRQSELDVNSLNPKHRPQVSFKNGREVPYGSRGSVRPDNHRVGEALEVKNYDLMDPSSRANMYNTIHRQYLQRTSNLPRGTQQRIIIDIRGQ